MNYNRKSVLVAGAGGFIGGHLVKRLLDQGLNVRAVDIKPFEDWYQKLDHAENVVSDLTLKEQCMSASNGVDEIYNLACDMGGMGFIENNKALCMLSVLINTHLLMAAKEHQCGKYFYASSACVYAADKQVSPDVIPLKESDAYPAMPEDGYGWEKLFSERMCRHFAEDYGLDVRIARFHNIYGPEGTWSGGREKAPAAICRKVLEAIQSGNHEIEIWGDGLQTRSFTFIDDCLIGVEKLMDSNFSQPINIGSSEMVSINGLVDIVERIGGVSLKRNYKLDAPKGVNGRNSDNTLIKNELDWAPDTQLKDGMRVTFDWIRSQMASMAGASE
ncbi:MAG: NAD-dependent epimerase/dehydratase family protein [Planctomycetota bacterium]